MDDRLKYPEKYAEIARRELVRERIRREQEDRDLLDDENEKGEEIE